MVENDISDAFTKNIEKSEDTILTLNDAYKKTLKVLKRYVKIGEEEYTIVALWLLGLKFFKYFPQYPYLFLNAAKQSGKTRLLKFMSFIANGLLTVNITEAVLFRDNRAIFIDEIENITKKEKQGIRELLNASYKKGNVVMRIEKNAKGEFERKEYEMYRPVALANINGMDDVLEDRCITINLERCYDKELTKRIEMFELDEDAVKIKKYLNENINILKNENIKICISDEKNINIFSEDSEHSAGEHAGGIYYSMKDIIEKYIYALFLYYNYNYDVYLHYIHYTLPTLPTLPTLIKNYIEKLIKYTEKSSLVGRDFEIFLPLFIIATLIDNDECIEKAVSFAEKQANYRKETNITENRDVIFIHYLAKFLIKKDVKENQFVKISEISKEWKLENEEQEEWLTPYWIRNTLKRHKIFVKEKRRVSSGVEVCFNKEKVLEKAVQTGFKKDEENTERENTQCILNFVKEDEDYEPE